MDPLVDPQFNRRAVYPIVFPDIWKFYKKHQGHMWKAESIKGELSQGRRDWIMIGKSKRGKDIQRLISYVLAFFAGSDSIVNQNLTENFIEEVQITEVKVFYHFQAMMEDIHNETYSLLLENYITDLQDREKMFKAIETMPSIKAKAAWALKWQNKKLPLGQRLFAYILVEGFQFPSSFAIIEWICTVVEIDGHRDLCPDLHESNQHIGPDEGLHSDLGIHLLNNYVTKPTQKEAENILREAMKAEVLFINDMIVEDGLLGMNRELMKQYVEYIGDYLLTRCEYKKIYNTINPFPFMVGFSVSDNRADFFEHLPTNYSTGQADIVNWEMKDDDFNVEL